MHFDMMVGLGGYFVWGAESRPEIRDDSDAHGDSDNARGWERGAYLQFPVSPPKTVSPVPNCVVRDFSPDPLCMACANAIFPGF